MPARRTGARRRPKAASPLRKGEKLCGHAPRGRRYCFPLIRSLAPLTCCKSFSLWVPLTSELQFFELGEAGLFPFGKDDVAVGRVCRPDGVRLLDGFQPIVNVCHEGRA